MEKIHILQLGVKDWNEVYSLPDWVQLDYAECFVIDEKEKAANLYDMVFLDRAPLKEEIRPLHQAVKTYTLFLTENVEMDIGLERLCRCKKAQHIASAGIQEFLLNETKYYYSKPYGAKFNLRDVAIAQGFQGNVKWNGNHDVTLEGEFGEEFRQVIYWRYNTSFNQGQTVDFWLEYSKDTDVSIAFEIIQFANGSISQEIAHWRFEEAQLQQVIRLESKGAGPAFLSISAKGKGKFSLIALHQRNSRGSHGHFLPGGERYVTHSGEEAFCYFDPGDLKPPLCVYFSGYKTLQGFEGYYMMKGMGCPFLLIAEPRLEGGGFYMGSPEYEKIYVDIIQKYMDELGFSANQVVLSGLSMGTYGALYYGCDIKPYAIILGKPLASIGNVAANEKHRRPGGFPTSLDVLWMQNKSLDEKAVENLNARFWNKFEDTDWTHTRFIVAYMIEDDYDANAYQMLISHMQSEGVQIYGKGLHGRHNDNTGGIVNWFLDRYGKVLDEDFARGKGKK